jgi:hypothetical protein
LTVGASSTAVAAGATHTEPHASITIGRRNEANAAAPRPVMWALSSNHSGCPAATGAQSATVSCGHLAAAARICSLISGQGDWLSRSVTQTTWGTPCSSSAFMTESKPAS